MSRGCVVVTDSDEAEKEGRTISTNEIKCPVEGAALGAGGEVGHSRTPKQFRSEL